MLEIDQAEIFEPELRMRLSRSRNVYQPCKVFNSQFVDSLMFHSFMSDLEFLFDSV